MRSPTLALLWHQWLRTRLLLAVFLVLSIAMGWLARLVGFQTGYGLEFVPIVSLLFLISVLLLNYGEIGDKGQGITGMPSRLYRLPLSSARLTAIITGYNIAVLAVWCLMISVGLYFAFGHQRWLFSDLIRLPLNSVTSDWLYGFLSLFWMGLFFLLICQALFWTFGFVVSMVAAVMMFLLVFGPLPDLLNGTVARLGYRLFGLVWWGPQGFHFSRELISAPILLGSLLLSWAGVAWDRHKSFATFSKWFAQFRRLKALLFLITGDNRTRPFRSKVHAQIWLEWRRREYLLPAATALCLLGLLMWQLIQMITTLSYHAIFWESSPTLVSLVMLVGVVPMTALVVAMFRFGISFHQDRSEYQAFLFVRPMETNQIARAQSGALLLGTLGALAIPVSVLLAVVVYSAATGGFESLLTDSRYFYAPTYRAEAVRLPIGYVPVGYLILGCIPACIIAAWAFMSSGLLAFFVAIVGLDLLDLNELFYRQSHGGILPAIAIILAFAVLFYQAYTRRAFAVKMQALLILYLLVLTAVVMSQAAVAQGSNDVYGSYNPLLVRGFWAYIREYPGIAIKMIAAALLPFFYLLALPFYLTWQRHKPDWELPFLSRSSRPVSGKKALKAGLLVAFLFLYLEKAAAEQPASTPVTVPEILAKVHEHEKQCFLAHFDVERTRAASSVPSARFACDMVYGLGCWRISMNDVSLPIPGETFSNQHTIWARLSDQVQERTAQRDFRGTKITGYIGNIWKGRRLSGLHPWMDLDLNVLWLSDVLDKVPKDLFCVTSVPGPNGNLVQLDARFPKIFLFPEKANTAMNDKDNRIGLSIRFDPARDLNVVHYQSTEYADLTIKKENLETVLQDQVVRQEKSELEYNKIQNRWFPISIIAETSSGYGENTIRFTQKFTFSDVKWIANCPDEDALRLDWPEGTALTVTTQGGKQESHFIVGKNDHLIPYRSDPVQRVAAALIGLFAGVLAVGAAVRYF